jgi:hypothetical protein
MIWLYALRSRSKSGLLARLVIGGLCIVGGLTWTLTQVQEMEVAPELEFVVKHQTEGLLNPLDTEKSTAVGHANMAWEGFGTGLRDPFGRGLGLATHISANFGAEIVGTEVDLSNMMVCLGLFGGIAYALVYFKVFRIAVTTWRQTRVPIVLGLLAVLLMLTGNWLNSGDYSTIALAWFCVGALDRISLDLTSTPLLGARA